MQKGGRGGVINEGPESWKTTHCRPHPEFWSGQNASRVPAHALMENTHPEVSDQQ